VQGLPGVLGHDPDFVRADPDFALALADKGWRQAPFDDRA
jgi:hypothetical protein